MNINDIKDIKPPVLFPENFFLVILLVSLAVLTAMWFLGKYLFKKFYKPEKKEDHIPPKKAHEIAYEALEILRLKMLPAAGKIKEYYFELSDILRHYLENRFILRAPEMTTEEFLDSLRNCNELSGAQKNILKQFLNQSDLVKFAKHSPALLEAEESFNLAKKVVDETKLEEAQPPKHK